MHWGVSHSANYLYKQWATRFQCWLECPSGCGACRLLVCWFCDGVSGNTQCPRGFCFHLARQPPSPSPCVRVVCECVWSGRTHLITTQTGNVSLQPICVYTDEHTRLSNTDIACVYIPYELINPTTVDLPASTSNGDIDTDRQIVKRTPGSVRLARRWHPQ